MRTEAEINLAYEIAVWWRGVKETSNKWCIPLFLDEHRYLVLKGGGGSGKSIFAGRKIIERCMAEPGHPFLVVRKVKDSLRESCWSQLKDQASEYYPGEYQLNESVYTITFKNGSKILMAGLNDVERLKSINRITGIWIEEASELLESDFNQLDIRLRGETQFYKQIILSFNPISIVHWLKKRFFDREDERALTVETTYKDNRFLDEENIRVLEGFKETDEYYYQVYCLGQWGVTGKTVFNAQDVARRLQDGILPKRRGYFTYDFDGLKITNASWQDDPKGFISIYKEPDETHPYVIGGDTAGTGSDYFVGQVVDNITSEQVAVLRRQTDEDVYAKQMYCLGQYYNNALVGIETNFSTYPVMELERLAYPNQYVRERVDDYTHAIQRSFGFRTDTKTRPVAIAGLVKAARDDINIICDKTTLEEMLTFVRDEAFKPVAEEGAHDDCVMALAIAHYIRPQQSYLPIDISVEVEWTPSMWEDYHNASRSEKEYLIEKWGKPKR